ncbi:MAG: hypothetical protein QM779_02145 [Propionicimonas sp.]|uniref:hypothetical protein n=1 Tax=Propionicimonas sp. TaxID=1955623 RepID=UPI003D10B444
MPVSKGDGRARPIRSRARQFWAGMAVGLAPGLIDLGNALGLYPFVPLLGIGLILILGLVLLIVASTRLFGAGLTVGSTLSMMLVLLGAAMNWLAHPTIVF